jgi:hypothetical protein
VLEPVSVGLKFGFLVILYLFLVWVAWSSMRDLRRGRGGVVESDRHAPSDATGMYDAAAGLGGAYDLMHGATLGRGNVEIHLEDPFASTEHARISREGQVFVIEDLGSTNGTYLNDHPLDGPQPLRDGDRIRIGDSEFSYLQ